MFITPWATVFQIPPWMGASRTRNLKAPTLCPHPTGRLAHVQRHSPGALLSRRLETDACRCRHCPGNARHHRTQNLPCREVRFTRELCPGAEVPLQGLDQPSLYFSRRTAPAWGLCQRFSRFSSRELSHLICKVTVKVSARFVLELLSPWTMKTDSSGYV